MGDSSNTSILPDKMHNYQFNNNTARRESDLAPDAMTTDSEEYLSEPLRYRNFKSTSSRLSNCSSISNSTLVDESVASGQNDNIQVPIIGYEIMEERARFTVYKLKIENKTTGDFWYVFRRYTDFVRLCSRMRMSHPGIAQLLPRKRWLKNNFDPLFLEERISGLQTLVNAILSEPKLVQSQEIQDFFCLNEPPIYTETNEESRAIFETLEETISELRLQLKEKDAMIDCLQDSLHSKTLESENLLKIIRSSSTSCLQCNGAQQS